MTDPDVKRELEENEKRAEQQHRDETGGLVDTAEEMLEPVVDLIEGDNRPDAQTERERAKENDAKQRERQS